MAIEQPDDGSKVSVKDANRVLAEERASHGHTMRKLGQVISAGDDLWNELENCRSLWEGFDTAPLIEEYIARWEELAGH